MIDIMHNYTKYIWKNIISTDKLTLRGFPKLSAMTYL